MASDGDTQSRESSARSYNPFQGGYTPTERRSHTPADGREEKLPKAPKGGTGEYPPPQTTRSSGTTTPESDSS